MANVNRNLTIRWKIAPRGFRRSGGAWTGEAAKPGGPDAV